MEALMQEAREKDGRIPDSLKEQIVLEHTPLIRYVVNRIAVRLPSHIDLDDLSGGDHRLVAAEAFVTEDFIQCFEGSVGHGIGVRRGSAA